MLFPIYGKFSLNYFANLILTIRYDTIDDLHWKTDRQAAI